jgi:hypothetical protein
MQSSEAVGFLGKSVEDLYGRHVGVVVGFSLKTNGDVDSLGVDGGSGYFTELKSGRLLFNEQALVVVPTWKADVARVTGEVGVLRRRISALHALAKDPNTDGQISSAQYGQLRTQYETRVAKIQESSEKIVVEIKSRMDELDQQDDSLAAFLVNVNIQFRSGEISEESFREISDRCVTMKARNAKERDDLMTAYGLLTRKEEGEARQIEVQIPSRA